MEDKALRQGSVRLLFALLGRFGVLGVGLIFAQMAYLAWTTGNPPPASLFSPRATVEVVEATIISGRQNGSLRHSPRVNVIWASEVTELRGLKGAFYSGRVESAEAIIQHYRAGNSITVRVMDGLPYADSNDWFRLGGALWLSVLALLFVSVGGVIAIGGRRRKPLSPFSSNSRDEPG